MQKKFYSSEQIRFSDLNRLIFCRLFKIIRIVFYTSEQEIYGMRVSYKDLSSAQDKPDEGSIIEGDLHVI